MRATLNIAIPQSNCWMLYSMMLRWYRLAYAQWTGPWLRLLMNGDCSLRLARLEHGSVDLLLGLVQRKGGIFQVASFMRH